MGNHTAGESCYQAFMKIFQIARCTVTCRNDVVIIVSNRIKVLKISIRDDSFVPLKIEYHQ